MADAEAEEVPPEEASPEEAPPEEAPPAEAPLAVAPLAVAPPVQAPPAEDEEEADEAIDVEDEEPEDGEEEEQESSEKEEEDAFELLNESEPDDVEEQAMYKEYLEVLKDIDAQNMLIQDLKAKATQLKCKRCQTFRDRKEYKQLRICQEQQDVHLQTLINRAALLQNFGSRRLYGDVEMELTEAEQCCFINRPPISSIPKCSLSSDDEECCCINKGLCWESASDSDSEPDARLCWSKF